MPSKSTLEDGLKDFSEAFALGLLRGKTLLTAGEHLIASRIESLQGEAGEAFAWLHQRKPEVYFEPELDVSGFTDWETALEQLLRLDLVDRFVPWPSRPRYLPLRILRRACSELGCSSTGKRAVVEKRLAARSGWIRGGWLRLRHRGLVQRILRFGLLRTRPDLSQRTVERLRGIRWPDYTPEVDLHLFSGRRALLRWEVLTNTLDTLSAAQLAEALKTGVGRAPGRLDRRPKLRKRLFNLARQLERDGDLDRAKTSYEVLCTLDPSHRGTYLLRWARCLDLAGAPKEALALLRSARSEATIADRRAIARAGKRIARRCNEGFPPEIPLRKAPIRHITLPGGSPIKGRPTYRIAGRDRHVEAAIATLLHHLGRRAIHGEGRLWTMLFALLFAEGVSFLPVPGQLPIRGLGGPLDLGTPSFFPRRKDAIRAVLDDLKAGQAHSLLRSSYERFYGDQLSGVQWSLASLEELSTLCLALGPHGLVVIMEKLLYEGWEAARGLPDLVILPGVPIKLPSFPSQLGAGLQFVEIKGPTDTLQDNQKLWLHTLLQMSLTAEVWQAQSPDSTHSSKDEDKGRQFKNLLGPTT
jgi:hypothetical protein